MNNTKDRVSIIIPTWNRLNYLKQCMNSIENNTNYPFEVIIIDNNSTDGTKKFVLNSDYEMDGQYIKNDKNLGFAIPNNQGAEIAKGNYLCFLNNDTIVTNNWLTEMIKVFKEENNVGMVGARLVHPGRGTIQHAGIKKLSTGIPNHIYFKKRMDYPKAMKRKEYFAVTGACVVIPKSLFMKLDGFNENYWCGWEDIDLCNKIKEASYKIIYEPNALVYHYESRTEGRYSKEDSNFTLYMNRWELK